MKMLIFPMYVLMEHLYLGSNLSININTCLYSRSVVVVFLRHNIHPLTIFDIQVYLFDSPRFPLLWLTQHILTTEAVDNAEYKAHRAGYWRNDLIILPLLQNTAVCWCQRGHQPLCHQHRGVCHSGSKVHSLIQNGWLGFHGKCVNFVVVHLYRECIFVLFTSCSSSILIRNAHLEIQSTYGQKGESCHSDMINWYSQNYGSVRLIFQSWAQKPREEWLYK